jgi:hypothetical protein
LVFDLGVKKYRPEEEASKLFAELIKSNYLNDRDIKLIKRLGYKVELLQTQPDEL